MSPYLNSKGVSTIQVVFIGAMVLALGVGSQKLVQNQASQSASEMADIKQKLMNQDIRYQLNDENVCLATLTQTTSEMTETKVLPLGVVSFKDNESANRLEEPRVVRYSFKTSYEMAEQVGRPMGGNTPVRLDPGLREIEGTTAELPKFYGNIELQKFEIQDYEPSTGLNFQQVKAAIFSQSMSSDESAMKNYQVATYFPIYLVTLDNQPVFCVSDGDGDAANIIEDLCGEITGDPANFDAGTGACNGIADMAIEGALDTLCAGNMTPGAPWCVHPYSGQTCAGRGMHDNYVIDGFNANGDVVCACVPRECPDPSLYCPGTDLGTNHCGVACTPGNKGVGAPPITVTHTGAPFDFRTDTMITEIKGGGPRLLACASFENANHCKNGYSNYAKMWTPPQSNLWSYNAATDTWRIEVKLSESGFVANTYTYHLLNPQTCKTVDNTFTVLPPSKGACTGSVTGGADTYTCTEGALGTTGIPANGSPATRCCTGATEGNPCMGTMYGCK